MSTILDFSERYIQCGLALTPLRPTEKRPYLKAWGQRPFRTVDDLYRHFRYSPNDNIGIVLGPSSGVVDIEHDSDHARAWLENILSAEDHATPSYVSTQSTHRLYRLPDNVSELYGAIRVVCNANVAAIHGLEVRMGLDGQTQSAAPPSTVTIPKAGTTTTYRWLPGLAPWEVDFRPFPEIVLEQVLERICIVEESNPAPVPEERPSIIALPTGDRVGDVFNARASWSDVLLPAGWKVIGNSGDMTLWQHPKSESGSHSAATGWRSKAGNEVLQVYSTNTPFRSAVDNHATYTKFEAFAILYHKGDRTEAARALAERGYKPDPNATSKSRTYLVVDTSAITGATA